MPFSYHEGLQKQGDHLWQGKAVADGPVDQVLTTPLAIFEGKSKVPFYKKQVINKSAKEIIKLVKFVILLLLTVAEEAGKSWGGSSLS